MSLRPRKIYVLCHSLWPFLFAFGCLAKAPDKSKDTFIYQYEGLSKKALFNFKKEYSADLGVMQLLNIQNKKKKFRSINHSPRGYFFNRKTKKITRLTVVVHNPAPRKLDSIFWAFLDSATYHYPVAANGSAKLHLYLNLNFYPRPRELIDFVSKNFKDLEYHIFSPSNFPNDSPNKMGLGASPDFIVSSIEVLK